MDHPENIKREYLLSFLVEEESDAIVTALIEKSGGEIFDAAELVKVRLAYPIRKKQFAFSGITAFRGAEDVAAKITAGLKFEPGILRAMTTIRPKILDEIARQNPEDAARARARRRGEKPAFKKFRNELSNEALEKKIEEILQ